MNGRNGGSGGSRIFIDKYIFMRYKQNILDKLEQAESIVMRLDVQLSRGATMEQVFETLDALKGQLDQTKSIVSLESDNFEQQFADR